MAAPPAAPASADPRSEARTIARNLRLRLASDGRAGLVALPRPAAVPAERPGRSEGADLPPPPAAPETVAAAAMTEALAARAVAPEPQNRIPNVHVEGPALFDAALPEPEEGASREEALARIVAEVAACERCPELCASRTKTVPGQGNPHTKLLFIGEGPGQDEDLQGLAFVGRAGQLLTKMIEAIGLTRDDVFIANIVKCRPPGNRQPTPEEAANCAPYLARQIAILRPKAIVALGGVAAQNLLQTHDGITRLRGRFYPYRGAKLMPTFHPAYVLRNYTPDTRKKVYDDLLKARAEMDA